ncbi:hypothetical protein J0A68_20195 [Algoriphagus sp. H41]|uniref:Lipoprotein n=1 Tax=Algoriphagus oliviformis TaxID=2811231 RepID=A0ABS3CAV8_9BACT|nr:hypothetical protein [Algoriphagus oliviformis]MBN7813286.1 hypothetical protein [Algoriphagus oliviformis]
MWKFLRFNPLLCLPLICACSGEGGRSSDHTPLHHSPNVKVLTVSATKFEVPDIDSRFQVVTFAANFTEWSFLNSPWEKSQADFPEVEYIFYYSGDDTVGLKEWMVENKFAYPIFHDYKGEFKELNIVDKKLTSISFLVKDGKQLGLGHAANPTYKEKLKRAFYGD